MSEPIPNPDVPPTPVTIDNVRAAGERIAPFVVRTPLTAATKVASSTASLLLKREDLQRTGSFKYRGATNAILLHRRAHPEPAPGVLTYSSGNQAQAIARAGRTHDVPTTIIMPTDAPKRKLDATRAQLHVDGELVLYDRSVITREELGARLAEQRGLTIIPPYDHPDVIAGQGTAAIEAFEQAEREYGTTIDTLLVCLGGGGLLSGCAIAAKATNPSCTVIGVEPANADDAARSFRTRTLHTVHNPDTIADGARTPSLGRYTFPIVLNTADDVITVTEDEIASAMRIAFDDLDILVEPSGALALAGVLKLASENDPRVTGRTVAAVLSGSNVDTDRAATLLKTTEASVEARRQSADC